MEYNNIKMGVDSVHELVKSGSKYPVDENFDKIKFPLFFHMIINR